MQPIQCAETMTVSESFESATMPSSTRICRRSSMICLKRLTCEMRLDARKSRKTLPSRISRKSLSTLFELPKKSVCGSR